MSLTETTTAPTTTAPLVATRERGVLLVAAGAAVGPYAHVYAFCTLATFAVAATALWLVTKEHR